ncbi:Magnesium transporter MgtE intracellular domain-containing protein, partial [Dysosmobacter welbionis]
GGEHQHAPARRQCPGSFAEGAVQGLRLSLFQQPLTVGRIGHQLAVVAVPVELSGIRHLEAHAVVHPRQLRVVAAQLHRTGVDVPAPD